MNEEYNGVKLSISAVRLHKKHSLNDLLIELEDEIINLIESKFDDRLAFMDGEGEFLTFKTK